MGLHQTARCGPARSTLRRWRSWLEGAPASWAFRLNSRFPQLNRYGDGSPFWLARIGPKTLEG